ncbi:hypothetical protein GQ54DRAFT_130312 [Martensiomyces pterosporus]|nr:hypothetical protein GQ54DRAFT_130312 [Martensiomyces pterosporus]
MTHQTSDGEAAAALLKEQESLLTVTAQASASTVKPVSFPEPKHTASPKLTPELEPLTIPPHSTDSHGFPSPTSSQTSSSGIDGMGTKQRSFQWRELLDPEFYPEITIRRTLFFFVWIVPHIIITTYFAVITPAPLVNGMNMASKVSILFDMAAILVFMSPTFLMLLRYTFLPRFITFEKNIHAHKVAAYTLLFWAATHVGKFNSSCSRIGRAYAPPPCMQKMLRSPTHIVPLHWRKNNDVYPT